MANELDKLQRKQLRRQERQEAIKYMMADVLFHDLKDAGLKKYMFRTDAELKAAFLTPSQIAKVRAWETPRSQVAYGLQAAHERVNAMMRRESDKPRLTVNVEKAVIRLPDQEDDEDAGIVIDIETAK